MFGIRELDSKINAQGDSLTHCLWKINELMAKLAQVDDNIVQLMDQVDRLATKIEKLGDVPKPKKMGRPKKKD